MFCSNLKFIELYIYNKIFIGINCKLPSNQINYSRNYNGNLEKQNQKLDQICDNK